MLVVSFLVFSDTVPSDRAASCSLRVTREPVGKLPSGWTLRWLRAVPQRPPFCVRLRTVMPLRVRPCGFRPDSGSGGRGGHAGSTLVPPAALLQTARRGARWGVGARAWHSRGDAPAQSAASAPMRPKTDVKVWGAPRFYVTSRRADAGAKTLRPRWAAGCVWWAGDRAELERDQPRSTWPFPGAAGSQMPGAAGSGDGPASAAVRCVGGPGPRVPRTRGACGSRRRRRRTRRRRQRARPWR